MRTKRKKANSKFNSTASTPFHIELRILFITVILFRAELEFREQEKALRQKDLVIQESMI
jgi:hypothetical protein